ncbi:MAG: hypothetical protein CL607_10160 [Anaerolineaceae bacterium]|nr:hypothetical protein [Anaerolineaceae bacterium]
MEEANRPAHPVIAICPKSKWAMFGMLFVLIPLIAFTLLVVAAWLRGWGRSFPAQFFIAYLILGSAWGLLNFFYRSPTLWLHEDGITVLLPFQRVFVKWEQIAEVRRRQSEISFYQLSPISRLLAFLSFRRRPFIRVGTRRKNYPILLESVLANIPERVQGLGHNKKQK